MATQKVIVDCAQLHESGLAAVEAIARAHLAAHRCGSRLLIRNPSSELLELICFVGLDGSLGVEVQRQAEQRK